jgi:hypothetical protein
MSYEPMARIQRCDIPCDCEYPLCQRVGDVVLSTKAVRGKVLVDRYCDCLLCGPYVFQEEIMAQYDYDGRLITKDLTDLCFNVQGKYASKVRNRLPKQV